LEAWRKEFSAGHGTALIQKKAAIWGSLERTTDCRMSTEPTAVVTQGLERFLLVWRKYSSLSPCCSGLSSD